MNPSSPRGATAPAGGEVGDAKAVMNPSVADTKTIQFAIRSYGRDERPRPSQG